VTIARAGERTPIEGAEWGTSDDTKEGGRQLGLLVAARGTAEMLQRGARRGAPHCIADLVGWHRPMAGAEGRLADHADVAGL